LTARPFGRASRRNVPAAELIACFKSQYDEAFDPPR
jgi:hypothetical protein